MQYTTIALAALATAASAAPIVERQTSGFSLISARSGSPVHLVPIVARGLQLWVGGETATYCPAPTVENCDSFKNNTVFGAQAGNPTGVGMSTNVPGGQLVYIAPGGAIHYTQAHSGYEPDGSVNQGFNYVPENNGQLGSLTPVANGSTGFLACPTTADAKESGPWQLIANVEGVQIPGGSEDDCYGIGALASDAAGPGAWQYA